MGIRLTSAAVLVALFALRTACAGGLDSDSAFQGVPFDSWSAEGHHEGIRWNVETLPAELSPHQRLRLAVRIQLNVRELASRNGNSHLIALAQLQDESGAVWRTQGALKRVSYEQTAFVLPGDYTLSVAAFDPDSGAYSFTRKKIHVAPLKRDPLNDSWKGLPAVEWFAPGEDPPDAWYLPEIAGRMNLPVATRRPVHLDVLLNATPAGKDLGSVTELRRNMDVLIPALKVISQLSLREGSLDVSMLDLVHRRVAAAEAEATQPKAGSLNWAAIREFFAGFNPGVVDVATLESQWKMRSFFEDQLNRVMQAPAHHPAGNGHAVIVLSAPAFFEGSAAEEAPDLDRNSDSRIFYIRYRAIEPEALRPRRRLRPGMRVAPPVPRPMYFFAMPLDDLEKPLEPLNSRIFDVISAEQFRRVLAAVIDQIGKL